MVRNVIKRLVWFCHFYCLINLSNSLPVDKLENTAVEEWSHGVEIYSPHISVVNSLDLINSDTSTTEVDNKTTVNSDLNNAISMSLSRQNSIRPGLEISQYDVTIEIQNDRFEGNVVIRANASPETRTDTIILHCEGLNIVEVRLGFSVESNAAVIATDPVEDGLLEIEPPGDGSLYYVIIIRYTGTIQQDLGIHSGSSNSYVAMNLNPTSARHVFPCIDELTESPTISMSISGTGHSNFISNTENEENLPSNFRAVKGPPRNWAIFAHDFTTYAVPSALIILSGRPGLSGQENQASVAISSFYNFYNEWTDKLYPSILANQNGNMHVIAVPDVSSDWYSLSIIGIWEPYVFMETNHAVKQRQVALLKIAEGMTRPWFGYTLFPRNWIYSWVTTGLSTYLAYEGVKELMNANLNEGVLDYDTIFVTDVIQESLRLDGYRDAKILEPNEFIYEEDEIRCLLNNKLSKIKPGALMYLFRNSLNRETDLIQSVSRNLFAIRSLETLDSSHFLDLLTELWTPDGFDSLEDFITAYTQNRGCPLLTVNFQNGLITLSRTTFSYSGVGGEANFFLPISFTTSIAPNFENRLPSQLYHQPTTLVLNVDLDDEDDWILFNIQGQGYYRVQYSTDLWERIVTAMEDPEERKKIHPLNRATLVDDSLNLARRIVSGLDYEIAFHIVLSMEHETEYAVWKAFVRNMGFLKKRLEAMVAEDEDLDQDIYLRMVRRTVSSVENELSFTPEVTITEPAMHTLTRALVMDHACRSRYDPCIAAAIDWFYASDNTVNPNIPHDLKPAVYCSVVREGDVAVRDLLTALLENVRTAYDRVVILESLACSQDEIFIRNYLLETISSQSAYSLEEKNKIFIAVAESSYKNALEAFAFLRSNTALVRERYGGDARLDELIFVIAENMASNDMVSDFQTWVTTNSNGLGTSELAGEEALAMTLEDNEWISKHLNDVYEWIDENDAPTVTFSLILLCLTAMVTLFH